MKKILIVAGDPSGDLIASRLVESMRKMEPELYVIGVGGHHLQRVSDKFLKNIVRAHALGFAISPKKLLFFRRILNKVIIPEIIKSKPDAVIPVDFYGFNSRVAQAAKNLGHHVFYYVSPQFWASRPGRADKLRKFVDLFLCLFPFEIDFYKKKQLPAHFVGHPILDTIPEIPPDFDPPAHVEANIGLLPGSRPEEIKRHLPVMIEACQKLYQTHPSFRLILFTVPHLSKDLYHSILSRYKKNKFMVDLVQDENYQWRSQLDLAISASGMETFENTLFGIPTVIMYKTNWMTYFIARALIQIKFLGMPNLLAGKEIVPEYIQSEATPSNIVKPLIKWLSNPNEKKAVRENLLKLRKMFGKTGASDRAAKAILEKVA